MFGVFVEEEGQSGDGDDGQRMDPEKKRIEITEENTCEANGRVGGFRRGEDFGEVVPGHPGDGVDEGEECRSREGDEDDLGDAVLVVGQGVEDGACDAVFRNQVVDEDEREDADK